LSAELTKAHSFRLPFIFMGITGNEQLLFYRFANDRN